MSNKRLSWEENRLLIVLGIPALGLALTYTLVTTYLPFFIEKVSGAAVTGILIGAEGIFALSVPTLIGIWSDSITTPIGSRLPFFFAGVLLTSLILILMPFSTHSLLLLGIELAFFFIGYFTIYEAYYALYPDLIPNKERGRSQGIMGGFRSVGMLLALMGGGFLINIWRPFPFLLFTFILSIVTFILYVGVKNKVKRANVSSKRIDWYGEWQLVRESKKIQLWLAANACWETSVSALRVFIVLYFTKGMGLTLNQSSGSLGLVGLSAIIAAPIAGFLADKYGHKPVILTSVIFFAFGLFPPIFTTNRYFLLAILPVAFSAVILMTLPFSMLMGYLPGKILHGTGSALFGLCQGIGVLIGPITAGIAVEIMQHVDFLVFAKTHGYSAIYLISSFFLFLSVPFSIALFRIIDKEKQEQPP